MNVTNIIELPPLEPELDLKLRLRNLHNFSQVYVARARDLAKLGQKDEARAWLRFFTNASVVKITAQAEFVTSESKQEFSSQLRLLESECHPLDVPDYATDLMAIRSHLERILEALGQRQVEGLKVVNE
jgi:hypothetical protein